MVDGNESLLRRTMTGVITRLRGHTALLQTEVDKGGEELARRIAATSLTEAAALRETYDKRWFARCLYSDQVKARVARALIDAVSSYQIIDVSLWQEVIRRIEK